MKTFDLKKVFSATNFLSIFTSYKISDSTGMRPLPLPRISITPPKSSLIAYLLHFPASWKRVANQYDLSIQAPLTL